MVVHHTKYKEVSKNNSTNGKPRKATIYQGTNQKQQTRRANQELILQISCEISMTLTRIYETQAKMGRLAYKKAREKK